MLFKKKQRPRRSSQPTDKRPTKRQAHHHCHSGNAQRQRHAAHGAGTLKGDGRFKGLVWISESGKVKGSVHAEGLIVTGQINGNIESAGKTELRAGARVTGDISCAKIAVAEDCFFQGEIDMSGGGGGPHIFTEKRQRNA